MNKRELASAVADKTGLSRADSAICVSAVFEAITEAMKAGEKVLVVGFGAFEGKHRVARASRNPRTKETVIIPASTVPNFRAGKALKDALSAQ